MRYEGQLIRKHTATLVLWQLIGFESCPHPCTLLCLLFKPSHFAVVFKPDNPGGTVTEFGNNNFTLFFKF